MQGQVQGLTRPPCLERWQAMLSSRKTSKSALWHLQYWHFSNRSLLHSAQVSTSWNPVTSPDASPRPSMRTAVYSAPSTRTHWRSRTIIPLCRWVRVLSRAKNETCVVRKRDVCCDRAKTTRVLRQNHLARCINGFLSVRRIIAACLLRWLADRQKYSNGNIRCFSSPALLGSGDVTVVVMSLVTSTRSEFDKWMTPAVFVFNCLLKLVSFSSLLFPKFFETDVPVSDQLVSQSVDFCAAASDLSSARSAPKCAVLDLFVTWLSLQFAVTENRGTREALRLVHERTFRQSQIHWIQHANGRSARSLVVRLSLSILSCLLRSAFQSRSNSLLTAKTAVWTETNKQSRCLSDKTEERGEPGTGQWIIQSHIEHAFADNSAQRT